MKQQLGKAFVLTPIGLFLISGALVGLVIIRTSDLVTGIVMGIGIGLASLPFILKRVKANS